MKAQPYKGPQNKSIPVDIVSLKLREAKYEFIVSDVVLKSRSPKPIESVQFIWRLVKEEGDSAVIKQEGFLTDILRIPRGLTKDREFKFGDFVLSIRKTMLSQVESGGIYTVLVEVDNLYYTDGSKEKPPVRVWKLRDVNKERRPLNSAGGSF